MRRNVASQSIGCQMITAADGTAFTGTVSVLVTIDNATQTAGGGTAPFHEGNGYHSYTPTQAETNGAHVAFTFIGTGAIPATVQVYPTSYDASGRVDVGMYGGTAGTFSGGRPEVNASHFAGTAYATALAAEVDAVWDEAMAGHVGADSAGLVLNDWQDAGRLDAILDTVAADVVNIDGAAMRGTDSAALASVCTEARLSELDAATAGKAANQIDIIQTDTTTDIPAQISALNNVAATDIVSAGAITTLAGAVVNVDLVDTLTTYTGNTVQTGDAFARLGAPAGASVSADIAEIEAQTDDIGVAGAGLTAITGVTLAADQAVNVTKISGSATAADNLEASALGIITGATTGTPTTTVINTNITGYLDDELIGRVVVFTGGTAAGQASDITDYAATGGILTVTALATAPAASDTFVVV